MLRENREAAVAFGGVVEHGEGVAFGEGEAGFGGLVEEGGGDVLELGDPLLDVGAVGVEADALEPGVLDAEVGGGVGSGAGGPLPAAVVAGVFAIDELLHEEGFAEPPVAVQVFGEEHGGDHAEAIVHEAGLQELAHARIDDGEAGGAGGPALEIGLGAGPGESDPVGRKLLLKDVRVMPEDGDVELSPGEFFDIGLDGGLRGGLVGGSGLCPGGEAAVVNLANAEEAEAQILAEQGSRLPGGEIALLAVAEENAGVDEVLEAITRGAFPWGG